MQNDVMTIEEIKAIIDLGGKVLTNNLGSALSHLSKNLSENSDDNKESE